MIGSRSKLTSKVSEEKINQTLKNSNRIFVEPGYEAFNRLRLRRTLISTTGITDLGKNHFVVEFTSKVIKVNDFFHASSTEFPTKTVFKYSTHSHFNKMVAVRANA